MHRVLLRRSVGGRRCGQVMIASRRKAVQLMSPRVGTAGVIAATVAMIGIVSLSLQLLPITDTVIDHSVPTKIKRTPLAG